MPSESAGTTTSKRTTTRCPDAAPSTRPWFVIPADHKWFRNFAIARIMVEQLDALGMRYPKPTVDLDRIRREYHAAKKR